MAGRMDAGPTRPHIDRQACFATVRGDGPGEDSGERLIVGVQGELEARGTDIEREDHLPARAMCTKSKSTRQSGPVLPVSCGALASRVAETVFPSPL